MYHVYFKIKKAYNKINMALLAEKVTRWSDKSNFHQLIYWFTKSIDEANAFRTWCCRRRRWIAAENALTMIDIGNKIAMVFNNTNCNIKPKSYSFASVCLKKWPHFAHSTNEITSLMCSYSRKCQRIVFSSTDDDW